MASTARGASRHTHVAIIGTGFGGIGAGIQLGRAGFDDYLIFERADSIGGTWQANTYPGAQCDIPSALYSFSFAPNPDWSRLYPRQPEIKDYITRCADDAGVTEHIRFGHDVTSAEWDELAQVWRITAHAERDVRFTADVLVAATGPFSEPSVPDIEGLADFAGEVFHSADWDHRWQPEGKRVAVIGTGASAVQFVPQIQPRVDRLLLFQRTPTWILPHPDRPVAPAVRKVFRRFPVTLRALREACGLVQEVMVPGLVRHPWMLAPFAAAGKWNLRRQVKDPALREKLLPRYAFGCKRPTFSNTFYPALAAPNASVITAGITRVTPTGVQTADGRLHEVDTIILGTGFKLSGNEGFTRIRGRDGRSLAEVWAGGEMAAYMGTSVAGFPNMFQILGPNSVVYTSQVVTIEAQIGYLVDALRQMRTRSIRSIDVTERAQQTFVDHVDAGLARSVWNTGGCSSYYLSPSGRNCTFWPGFVFGFRRTMASIELRDFDIRMPGPHGVVAGEHAEMVG
ncbi:NAD(P)/FAD-dependent oxidoreductase [Gordonia sp. L191]|uniref:flavin-containing monooxygenase n=1 Tax=Gordonia sp. L191 TaxID=2982699 RepID=UPI0024C01D1E|nr:NAD(P)/FAD-dependent oxidoreductase [Gordonia sp. L191]WHU47810.1 NAD(P)/FAD-dependent oxidoreductase [Gordonia sp. L191]